MHKSKLINLLKRIDLNDWNALSSFLKSPYHNSNKKLVDLHGLLSKYHPNFSSPQLSKEKVFYKLFSKEKAFDQKQLANLMSQFLKQTESFFTIRQFEKEEVLKQKLLGEYFAKQNWYDLYKKNNAALLEKIEHVSNKSTEDYFNLFLENLKFYYHPGTVKLTIRNSNLQKAIEALTNLFVIESLRLGCETKSRELFLSDSLEMPLLEESRHFAQQMEKAEAKVHLAFIKLLEESDIDNFESATADYFEYIGDLEHKVQLNLFTILLNFANYRIHKGHDVFYQKLFLLYKKGLDFELLIKNGQIDSTHFSNIVINGLILGELKWVKKFIAKYQAMIKREDRNILVTYCNARILTAENNFDLAIALLNTIEDIQHSYVFRIRSLSLRCLFELYLQKSDYYDLLISKINAFERHIRRDKVWNAQRKQAYINYCRFLERATHLKTQSTQKQRKEINDELQEQPVIAKQWLIEKINQFH